MTDGVPQVSHWVAPESVPVRFDARYFAVAAPRDRSAAGWTRGSGGMVGEPGRPLGWVAAGPPVCTGRP